MKKKNANELNKVQDKSKKCTLEVSGSHITHKKESCNKEMYSFLIIKITINEKKEHQNHLHRINGLLRKEMILVCNSLIQIPLIIYQPIESMKIYHCIQNKW